MLLEKHKIMPFSGKVGIFANHMQPVRLLKWRDTRPARASLVAVIFRIRASPRTGRDSLLPGLAQDDMPCLSRLSVASHTNVQGNLWSRAGRVWAGYVGKGPSIHSLWQLIAQQAQDHSDVRLDQDWDLSMDVKWAFEGCYQICWGLSNHFKCKTITFLNLASWSKLRLYEYLGMFWTPVF